MAAATKDNTSEQLELKFSEPPPKGAAHCVDRAVIRNFRLCRDVRLVLDSLTPLVGVNNAGKSTILRAIAWALRPVKLGAECFFDESTDIEVALRVAGIGPEVLDLVPEEKHRKAIEPYCLDGTLWIRVVHALNSRPVQQVWDIDASAGTDLPRLWKEYPTGLPQAVNALLPGALHIDATKDLNEDLGKAKAGTTIKGLLDEIMGPVVEKHRELAYAMQTIRGILDAQSSDRSPFLDDFDRESTKALRDFFPGLSLRLNPASVELKEFFKAGDLMVRDQDSEEMRRFDQMGAGAQRSIQMALIRRLADLQRGSSLRSRRLLLIDEPELFLHPQGVKFLRTSLERLAAGSFQVVFSTHSPLMLTRKGAGSTIVVGRGEQGTYARIPLKEAVVKAIDDHAAQSRTLFELESLSDIYFSDLTVICEGKTERAFLPVLHRHWDHVRQTAFVSLRGCNNTPGALAVLSAMQVRARAIVDLDFGFCGAGSRLLHDRAGTLEQAKLVFRRLATTGSFALGDNGFPTKADASTGWKAFVGDAGGATLVTDVHQQLLLEGIWMWRLGSIEDVLGLDDKGEDVLVEREKEFSLLSREQLERDYPELVACFGWLAEGDT